MATRMGILDALTGNRGAVEKLEEKIAEHNTAIEQAREAVTMLRNARTMNLQKWITEGDDKAATGNGSAIVAADDNVNVLEAKRGELLADLQRITVQAAEDKIKAEWEAVRKMIKERAGLMRDLQRALEVVQSIMVKTGNKTNEIWDALPEKHGSRPASYGSDLYVRVNTYLFAISNGMLGRAAVNVFTALKQRNLVDLDADAQVNLLAPLERKLA